MYGFFLKEPVAAFTGLYGILTTIMTYFWIFICFLQTLLIVTDFPRVTKDRQRHSSQTKKVIMDLVFLLGLVLFIIFIAKSYSFYVAEIRMINGLGGYSDAEREEFYVIFKLFFVYRVSLITILMTIFLFGRFSFLPYIEDKKQAKIQSR
jgi:uncharacterized BrkB/YihY/UPF0761 family membrane protein